MGAKKDSHSAAFCVKYAGPSITGSFFCTLFSLAVFPGIMIVSTSTVRDMENWVRSGGWISGNSSSEELPVESDTSVLSEIF